MRVGAFGVNGMLCNANIASSVGRVVAFALGVLLASAARAQFPPEGATSDPSNPSIAAGDIPDPSQKGVVHHYVFYFDCVRRDWIGTSVPNATKPSPSTVVGKEFPSGPPTGAKRLLHNPDTATDAATGLVYRLQNGSWYEAKTGKISPPPKLCPEAATPTVPLNSDRSASSSGRRTKHPPSQGGNGSDHLPPPPQYLSPRSSDR